MTKHCPKISKTKIFGIIPARFGSTRFPGKMLAPLAGKTLLQHTHDNAKRCSLLDRIVVATDDERIFKHVQGFGGEAVMTSTSCATGTDRLVEALQMHSHLNEADVVINIQGDEPCLDPQVTEQVIQLLLKDPAAVMSTAVVPLISQEEALNPSVVKCVIDQQGNALYFSRTLIPAGHTGQMKGRHPYYRHMGIYGFRRDFLLRYTQLAPTPLQQAEDLEQLKVLEHGFRIKVAIVDHMSVGVDHPEDIQKVEQWLCKQNTSSSRAASARH